MFEKFDIEKQIDKIYDRFARLKSGGYLVFDETESLVAIDVNTGRFVGKRNLEDTAYKTNLEAAEEIPRQLKLRDIGGIIIIDFIDMEVPSHRTHVFRTLERALDNDKARTKILNISSIGIVEMTRQRQRKSIEGKNYQKCPYCNGRGLVKSPSTIAIELVRELERTVVGTRSKAVWVTLHPEVVSYVSAPERGLIKALEHRFRKIIRLTANPNQRFDEIKIEQGSA
jgi:ribonuclease G